MLLKRFSQPQDMTAPCDPWAGEMLPRKTGRGRRIERSGGGIQISPSVRIEWASRRTDAEGHPLRVRTPQERTRTLSEAAFVAAGRPYAGRGQLIAQKAKDSPWAKDIYGRDVLALTERFPCFDSEDFLHEKRYFRWYFLCRDGRLTCVYHADETPTVTVTEDVLDVEDRCWEEMKRWGCFGEETDGGK